MEYELKNYYRVKYALVCARQSFLKNPPKDDYEEYARKVIGRSYFIVLNKIDELDGTNERLLKYYRENIEKYKKCNIIVKKTINYSFSRKIYKRYKTMWLLVILAVIIVIVTVKRMNDKKYRELESEVLEKLGFRN